MFQRVENIYNDIISAGLSDLLFLKKTEDDETMLVISKIGMWMSNEINDFLLGYAMLDLVCKWKILGNIVQEWSILHCKSGREKTTDVSLVSGKLLGYSCVHCLHQIADHNQLRKHIAYQHCGPVKCKMCLEEMEDIQTLQKHAKLCSYPCGVEGCELKHKRVIEAQRHRRKFLKSSSI